MKSSVVADVPFGTLADGVEVVTVTVVVADATGAPLPNVRVILSATGSGNHVVQPALSDDAGVAVGTLASTVPGLKSITATVEPGGVVLDGRPTTEFVSVSPDSRFVRVSGSDANDGTSPLRAWRTLGYAAAQALPGQTIHVGAGLYPEAVEITTVASPVRPVVFRGDGDGCFTGDAGDVVVDAQGAEFGFRLNGAENVVVRGFDVTGAVVGAGNGAGIVVAEDVSRNVFIVENDVYGNERGIGVRLAQNFHVESNRISNNVGLLGDGVALTNVLGGSVRHNLIYNNSRHGLLIATAATDVVVELDTFYYNGDDQIHEQVAGNTVTIRDCVIAEGMASGLSLPAGSLVVEEHNLIWGHVGSEKLSGGGGAPLATTSINMDPLLVDPWGPDGMLGGAEGDDDMFLLQAGSPGLDAGSRPASQSRLLSGGFLTGFTSRLDGLLDGQGADGPTLNIGYHHPAPFDGLEPFDGPFARACFGRADDVRAGARRLAEGAPTWEPIVAIPPTNATVRWIVNRISPRSQGEELVVALTDDGVSTELFVRRWDGRKWRPEDPFTSVDSRIPSANANQRGFDLEYERSSGDALLVYSDATSNPLYRRLEDGVWSADERVFATPADSGAVLWVELVARPGTDELALICLDDQQSLTAAVWDGQAWDGATSPTLLNPGEGVASTFPTRCFDAAYESVSGDLLVAWGHTLLIEEIRYATKSAGSSSFTTGLATSADSKGAVVRVAADPTSDRIVVGVAEAHLGSDTSGLIWGGSSWIDIVEIDTSSSPAARDLAVAWAGVTPTAVVVYADADGAGTLDWARWNGHWSVRPDFPVPGIGDLRRARTLRAAGQTRARLVLADDAGALHELSTDGTSWRVENGGQPLATGLVPPAGPAVPFDVDVWTE